MIRFWGVASALVKMTAELPYASASIVSYGVMTGVGSVVNFINLLADMNGLTGRSIW